MSRSLHWCSLIKLMNFIHPQLVIISLENIEPSLALCFILVLSSLSDWHSTRVRNAFGTTRTIFSLGAALETSSHSVQTAMFLVNSRRTALFALQSYGIIQTQKHSTCNCCVGSPSFPFFIFLLLGFFLECKYLEMYPIPLLFINIKNLTSLQIINAVKAVV